MTELNYQLAKKFIDKNLSLLRLDSQEYEINKLASDASFRSYYRIKFKNNFDNLMLMYAPVGHERIDHFIHVDKFLVEHNLSAPQIKAIDEENGFLLLEDFGDNTFTRVLKDNPELELDLYKKACDVLIELHKIDDKISLESFNNHVMIKEVMLFIDWYLQLNNKKISLSQIANYKKIWFELFDKITLTQKKVVVLRDYHADNLMLLNNKDNYKSIGLLDFQDALIGSPVYDLISLLDDIRRDIAEENRQELYKYFISKTNYHEENFLQDCEIISLQRNVKILGIFARLVLRDKKDKYLEYIPRVKYFVECRLNSSNPIFNDIKIFFNKLIN